MLNWIVWNRTDYLHKNGFGIKYIYIYIYRCANMKKQSIEWMILFLVRLFANVKCFCVYIKPSLGQLICDVISSELY